MTARFMFAALAAALFAALPAASYAFFDDEGAENCTVTFSNANGGTACYDGIGGMGNVVHNCSAMSASAASSAAAALGCGFVNRVNTPNT